MRHDAPGVQLELGARAPKLQFAAKFSNRRPSGRWFE